MDRSRLAVALERVPATLLLPLWGRAALSRTGNRVLVDEAAVALVDRLDYDFTAIRADLDPSKNLSWIARARQFDDEIRAFAARHPGCTVVNLGAGLDTTFARVDDGRMRWIDLDLPPVVELRRALLPESERSTCLAASVVDPAWMDRVPVDGRGLLFVAGGLLFYFAASVVVWLFRELGRRFPGAEIVFDAMSPPGVRKANAMLERVGIADAVLRWGLSDARTLERWGGGFELLDQYEYFRGLDLRGLPLPTRVMALVNRALRVMTIVHGRFTGAPAGATGRTTP